MLSSIQKHWKSIGIKTTLVSQIKMLLNSLQSWIIALPPQMFSNLNSGLTTNFFQTIEPILIEETSVFFFFFFLKMSSFFFKQNY